MRASFTLKLLGAITLVQCTVSGIFGPILLQILINAHIDPEVISHLGKSFGNNMFSVVLVYLLCPAYLFLAPLVCAYTDEWGRRNFFCASILASILGYGLIWMSLGWGSEYIFLFGLFFFSASKIYLPVAMTIATDLRTGRSREWAFGLTYLIMLVILLASQYGYYIVKEHYGNIYNSIDEILVSLMILEAINLSIALSVFPETLRKKGSLRRPLVARILHHVASIFKNKKMPGLFLLLLCTSFFWSLYFQMIDSVLTNKFNLSFVESNEFILYQLSIMVLGVTLLYYYFIKHITYHRILAIFGVAITGFIGCGLFTSSLIGQIIFVIPLAIGSIIIGPLLCSLIAKEWDQGQRGLLMGIITPALTITWILSGIIPIELDGEFSAISMFGVALGGTIIFILVKSLRKELF